MHSSLSPLPLSLFLSVQVDCFLSYSFTRISEYVRRMRFNSGENASPGSLVRPSFLFFISSLSLFLFLLPSISPLVHCAPELSVPPSAQRERERERPGEMVPLIVRLQLLSTASFHSSISLSQCPFTRLSLSFSLFHTPIISGSAVHSLFLFISSVFQMCIAPGRGGVYISPLVRR